MIRAAVERGVDVRVFMRPDEDRNMAKDWAQRQLPGLLASGATVIRSDQEHRKIVVIDDEVVLIGSLNSLSNTPGTTREIMITMEGRAFAARLLAELRVDEIGTPRACGAVAGPWTCDGAGARPQASSGTAGPATTGSLCRNGVTGPGRLSRSPAAAATTGTRGRRRGEGGSRRATIES